MNKTVPLLIASAVVVLGGAYLLFNSAQEQRIRQAHAAYQAQIRAIQSEGVPIEMGKLQDPLPPPELDAGAIYEQIARQRKARPLTGNDKILMDGLGGNHIPSPKQFRDAHVAVQHRADLLTLIHTAAQRPQCVLHIDWKTPNPADVTFPQFVTIRASARVLSVESMDLAHQGRMREAVQNQALGFRLADHALTGKTAIAGLVAIAVNAITLEGMKRIFYLSNGDPIIAQDVSNAVRDHYHSVKCSEVMKNELTFRIAEAEYLRKTGPKGFLNLTPKGSDEADYRKSLDFMAKHQWNAYLDNNGALMLAVMRQHQAIIDQPFSQSHPQLVSQEAAFDKQLHSANGMRYLIATVLEFDPTKFASKKTLNDATADVVQTSARLMVEKSKTNAFPNDLSALDDTPLDPFTGKALHYRREGDGFILYSVGEDGNFDGGVPTVKPKKSQAIFRYPMPEYYRQDMKAQ